jgi:hypothetical protein
MMLRRYPSFTALALLMLLAANAAAHPLATRERRSAQPPAPTTAPIAPAVTPHLTLSVDKPSASFGALITLHITYTNIGLQWTTVTSSPADLVAFDPPRSMPCKYDQDATQCQEMTLRAIGTGIATIHASAYGEIYDDACKCWRFSGASDDGPAIVTIGPPAVRVFVPLAQR